MLLAQGMELFAQVRNGQGATRTRVKAPMPEP